MGQQSELQSHIYQFYSKLHETTRLLVECNEPQDSSKWAASTHFSLENEPLMLVEINFSTNIFYTQYIISQPDTFDRQKTRKQLSKLHARLLRAGRRTHPHGTTTNDDVQRQGVQATM